MVIYILWPNFACPFPFYITEMSAKIHVTYMLSSQFFAHQVHVLWNSAHAVFSETASPKGRVDRPLVKTVSTIQA